MQEIVSKMKQAERRLFSIPDVHKDNWEDLAHFDRRQVAAGRPELAFTS